MMPQMAVTYMPAPIRHAIPLSVIRRHCRRTRRRMQSRFQKWPRRNGAFRPRARAFRVISRPTRHLRFHSVLHSESGTLREADFLSHPQHSTPFLLLPIFLFFPFIASKFQIAFINLTNLPFFTLLYPFDPG